MSQQSIQRDCGKYVRIDCRDDKRCVSANFLSGVNQAVDSQHELVLGHQVLMHVDYDINYIRDAILSQLAIDCQTRHEVLERFIGRVMLTDLKTSIERMPSSST